MHQIDFAFNLKKLWSKRIPKIKKQNGSIYSLLCTVGKTNWSLALLDTKLLIYS